MNKRQAIIAEIPKLRRFARGLTGDSALADDLVQDCLERALERLHLWQEKNQYARLVIYHFTKPLHQSTSLPGTSTA